MVRKLTLAMALSLSVCGATTVKFTHVPSSSDYGTYNGFSIATVAGIPNQLLMCNDPVDTTYMPSSELTYDVIRFDGENTDHFMYGKTPDGPTVYKEAAVLLYWFVNAGGMSLTDAVIANYQYAIWHLTAPGHPSGQTAGEQTLQNNALDMVQSHDPAVLALLAPIYSSMLVYTPVGQSIGNQEFLQYSAPEPGTRWLLAWALGIGGVVMAFRRLRRPAR